jgi:hypothetical protein
VQKNGSSSQSSSQSRTVLPIFSNSRDHGKNSQFSGDEVNLVEVTGSPRTEKGGYSGIEVSAPQSLDVKQKVRDV